MAQIYYMLPAFMMLDAILTRLAIPLGAIELNPLQILAGTNLGLVIHLSIAGVILLVIHKEQKNIQKNKNIRIALSTLLFINAIVVLNNSIWIYTSVG